jgi:hypothetical protein
MIRGTNRQQNSHSTTPHATTTTSEGRERRGEGRGERGENRHQTTDISQQTRYSEYQEVVKSGVIAAFVPARLIHPLPTYVGASGEQTIDSRQQIAHRRESRREHSKQ